MYNQTVIPEAGFLSLVQALTLTELPAGLSPSASGPVFPSQVNGHGSGSAAHSGESLREDLQELLDGEVPPQQLNDLTKVNPVTLETGMPPLPTHPTPEGCAFSQRVFGSAALGQTGRGQPGGLLQTPAWRLPSDSPTQALLQMWSSS